MAAHVDLGGAADLVADYIVVGAGSSGCVVAARLSEDQDASVWLAEAGPVDDFLLSIPGALLRSSTVPKFNWNFSSEEEPAMAGRKLFWSQGKVLGGGSSINGMIYTRGAPEDYDAWAAQGCSGWSFNDVLPYFRKSETNERGASHWHGQSGPISVTRGDPRLGIMDRFLAAAVTAGHRVVDDFNAGDQAGFGHYDRTIGDGRRSSTARAFLWPLRQRDNLAWSTRTFVERILFKSGRACGVVYVADGVRRTAWATREIILCAGAIKSPQILMLSGVGPADHLREQGIEVLLDAPSVGANLGNHVLYPMHYGCSEPITAYTHSTPLGAARAVASYAMGRRGILAQTPISTGGFLRSDPSQALADIQIQAMIGLAGQVGQSLWSRLPKRHGFTLMVSHGKPESRGSVRLRSSVPSDAPLIRSNLLSKSQDMETLANGICRVREILAAPALAKVIQADERSGAHHGKQKLEQDIRGSAYQAFHGTGTCRMGSDSQSVVDPLLRVRGMEALRVADASIFPTIFGANMNAPAIMVGERCADFIKGNRAPGD